MTNVESALIVNDFVATGSGITRERWLRIDGSVRDKIVESWINTLSAMTEELVPISGDDKPLVLKKAKDVTLDDLNKVADPPTKLNLDTKTVQPPTKDLVGKEEKDNLEQLAALKSKNETGPSPFKV